jgi:hypothetical protein
LRVFGGWYNDLWDEIPSFSFFVCTYVRTYIRSEKVIGSRGRLPLVIISNSIRWWWTQERV